jgi:hypothetical protein
VLIFALVHAIFNYSFKKMKTIQSSWYVLSWTDPPFSTWPNGNVQSSELTEHRGIASAACPHVALLELYLSTVIHSFIIALAQTDFDVNIAHLQPSTMMMQHSPAASDG